MPKKKQNPLSATTEKFSTNMPHNAVWLVYIDGIEIPVNSVSVQFGVWQIPTAQITVPPHIMLQRLGFEDRILVEIFYLDEFYHPNNPQFRMMGEYEIIEWGYTNTGMGRAINFSLRSTLQIFEQLKFYYMSSVDDIVTANSSVTGTSSDTVTTPMVSYPLALFRNGLVPTSVPITGSENIEDPLEVIKSPSEFVWNIFKALRGDVSTGSDEKSSDPPGTVPRSACAVPGRNFFGRWLRKTDFVRRWTALYGFDDELQKDPTTGAFPLLNAVTSVNVMNALADQIGVSVGDSGTAWEILQKVMGVMLMEIGTTPAPPIASLNKDTRLFEGSFTKRDVAANNSEGSILAHYVKPQCIFAVPPRCNIIFPSMIESYSFNENFMAQPTRVYLGEDFLNKILTAKDSAQIGELTKSMTTTGYPHVVKLWMKSFLLTDKPNTKNFLIYPEELHKGPVTRHIGVPPWAWMLEQYYKALGTGTESGSAGSSSGATGSTGATYTPSSNSAVAKGKAGPLTTLLLTTYKTLALKYLTPLGYPNAIYVLLSTLGAESGGNPMTTSNQSSAKGLGQTLQSTFDGQMIQLRKNKKTRGLLTDAYIASLGGLNIYNPELNIAASAGYLVNCAKAVGAKNADFILEDMNADPENDLPATPTKMHLVAYAYGEGSGSAKKLKNLVDTKTYRDGVIKSKNLYKDVRDPGLGVKKSFLKKDQKTPMEWWRKRSSKIYARWKQLAKADGVVQTMSVVSPSSAPQAKDYFISSAVVQSVSPERNMSEDNKQFFISPNEAQKYAEDVKTDRDFKTAVANNNTIANNNVAAAAAAAASAETTATTDAETQQILGGLFDLYAKYEYFRSRYEPRAAALKLAFDPYIVPGFPAVVFDSRDCKFDIFGYVQSVSHTWSAEAPEISTSVTLGYLRSFPEFLNVYKERDRDLDLDGFMRDSDTGFLSAPRDPIAEVAQVMQTIDNAEEFYSSLLYTTPEDTANSSIFNWEEMLDLYKVNGELIPEGALESWVWEEGMYVDPKPTFQKLFTNYDEAMHYVSRPAVTLTEFRALKDSVELNDITKIDDSVDNVVASFNSEEKDPKKGAVYYKRIFELRQGPGNIMDPNTISQLTGMDITAVDDPIGNIMLAEWARIDLAIEDNRFQVPQTRRNWDKVLKEYRKFVRSKRLSE
jgi:hypothetical protein